MTAIPNVKALEGAIFTLTNDRLAALLERGLGLAPTAANISAFGEQCRHRARGLGLSEEAYFDLLISGGPSARTEWMALAPVLTVGETFLFRDAALWNLIESTLLPSVKTLTRPLWLWSAGCSTGEEAYTLAIVARRALPADAFFVLGTDVNPKAIAAARVGVYTQWSLRGVGPIHHDGLIVSGTQTVRVHEDIKKLVRFESHNLSDPAAFPPSGMVSFECIVCRNVLIYMTASARSAVIQNLIATLTPGGVLVLGHGEATGIHLPGLVIERYDAGVVYRKPLVPIVESKPETKSLPGTATRKTAAKSMGKNASSRSPRAPKPSRRVTEFKRAAELHATPPRSQHEQRAYELLQTALRHARAGQAESAERTALAAIAASALDPAPYVLLAALQAARDAFKQAETALRRALFLDPAYIPAMWQLGTLFALTDRKRQAEYAFARLLARLEGLPPEREALPFDNLTVGELATLLRAALGEPANA